MLTSQTSEWALTTDFIISNIHVSENRSDTVPQKNAKKSEKPQEFFSFFLETLPFDEHNVRNDFRARQHVADTISKSRDRLKACGMKETTACPDLLQRTRLRVDAIASVCAVYNINCILLSGKLAYIFEWGTNNHTDAWLILEQQGKDTYIRSKLKRQHILENYLVTTSATKPLYSIGKYTATEVRRMWELCELGGDAPKTKQQAFNAVVAYVAQRTKSVN